MTLLEGEALSDEILASMSVGRRSNVHFVIAETGPQPFRNTLLKLLAETFLRDIKFRVAADNLPNK